ncbi:efflux RND transporter permease subunit [Pseudovibrio sp. Tun.PSC04-5.I4]|uniref:efflux RND transporter permease subunit n=1 Tax=Pseudovibrio sp. Tun.PSC04-5.I4 TaxID=1798213 RepID=UPI000885C280|nr:efflux RND transporter permease subunit [Pseudovibrio sp. Tun.PSC04-5.I4]SDR37567.1 Multidrug efflux pump subunit AcrB [Pseudovibrio sp. Tun.PSC04-5.I4]
MDIARYSIEKPVNVWMVVLIAFLGGLWALGGIGRLEDPAFTIKEAQVITSYPGASAAEVEEEVTERLESAIQQMPQLKQVRSTSEPGLSRIQVEMKETYDGTELPQVWDELRRKVGDEAGDLPSGARTPTVYDSFGDVFGMYYALTAEGYSNREIRKTVKELRRELLTVDNVAKVSVLGAPEDEIVIEMDQDRLAQLGITVADVQNVLNAENAIQANGTTVSGDLRIRISTVSAFDSYRSIQDLVIGEPGSTAMVRLSDVATLSVQEPENPKVLVRHNGQRAFTLGVAAVKDTNVVAVGKSVEAHLSTLRANLPVGMEVIPIYEQHNVVDKAVGSFVGNLIMSVSIVIVVLGIFMGWRAAVVVGSVLLLTVLSTILLMKLGGIELERISLGALVIAMGMLVDNAIVVAEGMMINMQRGMRPIKAASTVVEQTKWPLLGATVIGVMAFSGIGLSNDSTGEFMFSLFAVVGISLLMSWFFAILVTPLFGKYFFKMSAISGNEHDPYKGMLYTGFRKILVLTLRLRWLSLAVLIGVTVVCFWSFQFVSNSFFPNSATPMFYVNYWLPHGTDIHATAKDMEKLESEILSLPGVVATDAFVGRGATRFMLTYASQDGSSNYGQIIVRTENIEIIDDLALKIREFGFTQLPRGQVYTERLVFGPPTGADVLARISGPDANVLRSVSDQIGMIFKDPQYRLSDVRTDWRERELVMQPKFDEQRARIAGITRQDLSTAIKFTSDGIRAGSYRDEEEDIPIIVKRMRAEGETVSEALVNTLVWSSQQRSYVPIDQVTSGIATVPEDTLIRRRDRVKTISVMGASAPDELASVAHARIRGAIEAVELPNGYVLEWGGEYENSKDANESLGGKVPVTFLVMIIISILLFSKVREPLIIWLIVPMSINGVVIGLLGTGMPLDFMAILGVLSLSGMLIKNAIVLLEEIDLQLEQGGDRFDAVVNATVSRLRPVSMAAITTILGMAPLIVDPMFASMSVTIMGGLTFATLLTLIAVPLLFIMFYRIRPGEKPAGENKDKPMKELDKKLSDGVRAEPELA